MDELVGVFQLIAGGTAVCPLHVTGGPAHDGAEIAVVESIGGKLCHVCNGGVMRILIHAVGIDEVGAGHAELSSLFVHHVREAFNGSADVYGDGGRGIVTGAHHEAVEQLAQFDALTVGKTHQAAAGGDAVHFAPAGDGGIEVAVFQCHDAGHDLGGAGGAYLLIGILRVKYGAGGCLNKDHVVGGDIRGVRVEFREGDAHRHTAQYKKRRKEQAQKLFQNSQSFQNGKIPI